MRTDMQGVAQLRRLRQEFQEDAGADYPADVMTQLMVLYDVGKALDLNFFQLKDLLGEVGFSAVRDHINRPACVDVDLERVTEKKNVQCRGYTTTAPLLV